MKSGSRSLGIAFSDGDDRSWIAGALVRTNGRVDDLIGGTCTVGGTDATASVIDLVERLDREDARRLVIAGVAPAWFNLVDIEAIHRAVDRPVISVSFEASPGLEPALREQFDGDALAARLATYRSLPDRRGTTAPFVRAVGLDPDRAADVVREVTVDDDDRPEPVRVAKRAARAFRRFAAEQQ
ncbi:DUF99 family protein [Halopenitus sp. POP-27]|uniref:endonuclease dU n=1 Tax=Halopenitus sp. POP-27 TaxID=2994425 RepID=UPI00246975BE|nr:DUF99 family protein [Halopenitus sp. POP-27]